MKLKLKKNNSQLSKWAEFVDPGKKKYSRATVCSKSHVSSQCKQLKPNVFETHGSDVYRKTSLLICATAMGVHNALMTRRLSIIIVIKPNVMKSI